MNNNPNKTEPVPACSKCFCIGKVGTAYCKCSCHIPAPKEEKCCETCRPDKDFICLGNCLCHEHKAKECCPSSKGMTCAFDCKYECHKAKEEGICGIIVSSGTGKKDGHACFNEKPCPVHAPIKESIEGKCKNCGEDIALRNPTGKCDHLYYPDNLPTPPPDSSWDNKIWHSTTLEVDNVGVVLKQVNGEFFLNVSGTKEISANITNVFENFARLLREEYETKLLGRDTTIEGQMIMIKALQEARLQTINEVREELKKLRPILWHENKNRYLENVAVHNLIEKVLALPLFTNGENK